MCFYVSPVQVFEAAYAWIHVVGDSSGAPQASLPKRRTPPRYTETHDNTSVWDSVARILAVRMGGVQGTPAGDPRASLGQADLCAGSARGCGRLRAMLVTSVDAASPGAASFIVCSVSFRRFNLEMQAQTMEIRTVKGDLQADTSCQSGIRDPDFELHRELLRTDRSVPP